MSYAPQSPDLSGASYAPRSPDLSGATYAPRSPNLTAYDVPAAPTSAPSALSPRPISLTPTKQPLTHQPIPNPQTSSQPYLNVANVPSLPTSYSTTSAFLPESPGRAPSSKPRARKQSSLDDASYKPARPTSGPGSGRGRKAKKPKLEESDSAVPLEDQASLKPAPGVAEGIEVKTKFPVARIKRIMQHDEEVGKVAQVTPTAVSKALELFMISIVTRAASVAREKSSKKVTVGHMKQVVRDNEEFDFLKEVCEKYADSTAKHAKGPGGDGRGGLKKEETESEAD